MSEKVMMHKEDTHTMMMTAIAEQEVEFPEEFICPLTMQLMQDPVMSRYGQSYERDAILSWLSRGHDECPCTRQPLRLRDLVTNHKLRQQIHKWQLENQEDVTVFAIADDEVKVFGFITVPEKDIDMTERTEDDNSVVTEQPYQRRRRRWSTGQLSLGSFQRTNSQREQPSRSRLFGRFASRRNS